MAKVRPGDTCAASDLGFLPDAFAAPDDLCPATPALCPPAGGAGSGTAVPCGPPAPPFLSPWRAPLQSQVRPRCAGGRGRRRDARPYLAKSARAPPVAGRSAATLSHRADVTDGAPYCSSPYLVKQAAHWPAGQRAAAGKPGSGRAAPSPPGPARARDPWRSGSGRVCKLSARRPRRPSPRKPCGSQGGRCHVCTDFSVL